MSDIEARVKKIIAEQLGVEESQVTNEKAFVADLGADSLDTVELVMALEDEFGIESRFPTRTQRRSPRCKTRSTTRTPIKRLERRLLPPAGSIESRAGQRYFGKLSA